MYAAAETPAAGSVLELTQALVARPSLTPDDAGCSALIAERLERLGFALEWMNRERVTNLWATRNLGSPNAAVLAHPIVILAGHTDVVPPGPLDQWSSDPFAPALRNGRLYGRGAADMKSGLAAMVCAVERFLSARPEARGTLAFLITSDEEGRARYGTRHACTVLRERGVKPDYAVVGEASSWRRLGDRIVIGRRGSLGCDLRVLGRQGHVAYPERADNPIHRLAPALAELVAARWDEGDADFPPTSFQVSNLRAGTGANNVIPGEAELVFNFRYGPASRAEGLKARVHEVLDRHRLRYQAEWWHSGEPYLTRAGTLRAAARAAIAEVTGIEAPQTFTGGGTSDARFIAPLGAEVIELGPVNDSIHQADEHVEVADLEPLAAIYQGILSRLLA